MNWDDPIWSTLEGAYRIRFDPRPTLLALRSNPSEEALWEDLIENLYQQGDVGPASYAALPEIVSLAVAGIATTWQPIQLSAMIEQARYAPQNPPLPDWLAADYQLAFRQLATHCLESFAQANDPLLIRSFLAVLALSKGLRIHAQALDYSEEDLASLFEQGWPG